MMNKRLEMMEIKQEYKRVDDKWLNIHYKTLLLVIAFSFTAECIMSEVLYVGGQIENTSFYLKYYLFRPSLFYLIFITIGYIVMHAPKVTSYVKRYVITLLYVAVCAVLYTVHNMFLSLYLIFAIPVILSIIYSDYILTSVAAICSTSILILLMVIYRYSYDILYSGNTVLLVSNVMICAFVLTALYGVCMIVIRFEREKNEIILHREMERYHLREKIKLDELTDINNRTAFQDTLERMMKDTTGAAYFLAMVDIDNFKLLNDTLGHTQGDICLQEFGSILKQIRTESITPFRFGGDEFCIFFRNKEISEILDSCQAVQHDFRNISVLKSSDLPVTLSIGIERYQSGMSPAQLIQNTDSALYRAKIKKNAISIFDMDE